MPMFRNVLCIAVGIIANSIITAQTNADDSIKPPMSDPKSLQEGLTRVESVLGKYSAVDQQEWSLPINVETKQRPDPMQPEILLKVKGHAIVGLPMLESDSIVFDLLSDWKRQVYDLNPNGTTSKLTHSQRSHSANRYFLSYKSGLWLASSIVLSNGIHDSIGKADFQGVVKWHDDGFELVGHTGASESYAACGAYILGTSHSSTRIVRKGSAIVLQLHTQRYRLAEDLEGSPLIAPDFTRPFGSAFAVEYTSSLDGNAEPGPE